MKAKHLMTLQELAAWVIENDTLGFDYPPIDELTDEEEIAAREEYEDMMTQIEDAQ